MTLSVALRRGTRNAHDQLEQTLFFRQLEEGTLGLDRFVDYLRSTAAFHYAMDREMARTECRELAAVNRDSWLPALRHDISALGRGCAGAAVPAALRMTNDIRARAAGAPHSLVGFRYVFEGSVMGMPHVRKRVAACFGFDDCRHLHYLNLSGAQAGRGWRDFRDTLDSLEFDTEARVEVIEGARAAFDHIRAIADDLVWTETPPRLRADALNPEAGVHPIIADPLAIEASIVAGDQIWDRWAYCRERFAERGLGFARSDSAWLAMLADLPTPRASLQINWLANVLSARGMPSALLEAHLEVVHEAVVDASPLEGTRFGPLLDAAAGLRADRTAILAESRARELLALYDQELGDEAPDPLDLGFIAIEAVRDELGGRERSVASVLDWATPGRVGQRRAEALRALVVDARTGSAHAAQVGA